MHINLCVDQQRAGRIHGVFIDDTGSPGLKSTPIHLHQARKSWVAVFVPRSMIAEVWEQLPGVIAELKKLTSASEFHFTDIYMGRRQFKGIPFALRLDIFKFMAHIFGTYAFPVFVQTLDPDSLKDIQNRASFPERLGPFDFRKHEDLALFFLLLRVKWHLEKNYSVTERLARVFVDEGYKKNGVAICIPRLQTVFADGLICFAGSDTILPLQLADFAAFCLNRTQLIIGKKEPTQLDEQLLRVIEPLTWNYQNIPIVSLDCWFPKNEP